MATLRSAEEKWNRKMQNAGQKWFNDTVGKGSEYCEGMAQFFQQPIPGCPAKAQAFDNGVQAIGAQGFQAAVQGKGAKWAKKMLEAFQQ